MRIYAPRRAGEVAGAVLVRGADEGIVPTSARGNRVAGGVGPRIPATAPSPTRSHGGARDRRPRAGRRCRSAGTVPDREDEAAECRRSSLPVHDVAPNAASAAGLRDAFG